MSAPVTARAPPDELVGMRSATDCEGRLVVVFEQLGSAAVDATRTPLVNHPPLPGCRVAAPHRGVHRTAFGVVDEHANKCIVEQGGHC